MFDNKTLKVKSTQEMLFPQAEMCVSACVASSKTDKQRKLWASARSNEQKHTKHVKTAGLEIIHLNTVHVLIVCQYFVLKWQTGASSMLIKEQNERENHPQLLNRIKL